ncbi:flagellar biosynthetic protein FliR [Alkalicoccobacillus porphyridii]|uniref:Flagellar biosynthetic protein FliR n=1 Tax=Alkalicoccobacillus porphyridii TaxID=2597270 RepID=A0A553ZYB4_9BACI|nr:flagellar biosynthetic protein FliR [Alkalicoccobacillus porphyridii]TSB46424.1 flagellar type III secretion system protein FliR [Alkalicoccobacillus porphyridii]
MTQLLSFLPAFLLIFIRVSSFMLVLPLYSHRSVPMVFKLGLSIMLAWIMVLAFDIPELVFDWSYILLVIKEISVGLAVGLVAMILLYAIQVAGGLIDFTMGFMIANVVDPQTGAQSPLTGGFLYTFALLFLLTVNGHHLMLDGIYYSYQYVPLDQLTLPFGDERILNQALSIFALMFVVAVQIAFPIAGCLFLVDLALGMVSRTVPQMNVFVVGMPLKLLVGLSLLMVYMGVFMMIVRKLFDELILAMRMMLQLLGGG